MPDMPVLAGRGGRQRIQPTLTQDVARFRKFVEASLHTNEPRYSRSEWSFGNADFVLGELKGSRGRDFARPQVLDLKLGTKFLHFMSFDSPSP